MIKKRSIIAGLITFIIICFTQTFWLEKEPVTYKNLKSHSAIHFIDWGGVRKAKHNKVLKKYKHKQHFKYNFQYEIFVIILILSFLLSYKLVDYIADFKTVKEKSRIDIIFLTIFFVLLFLPMSKISNAIYSKEEQRYFTTFKPLITNMGNINYSFGKDFDNWYNDRFCGRKYIIDSYSLFKTMLAKKYFENNKMFYIKSKKFIGVKNHIPSISNFSENDVASTLNYLEQIANYCNKNNIKLYVIIPPYNQFIYQDIVKPFDNPQELIKVNNAINQLKELSKAKIIYPYYELKLASENNWVYFKTDHHWTDEGAYIGYQVLMDEINKDFPDVKKVHREDFNIVKNKKVRASYSRKFNLGNQLMYAGAFLKPYKKKILQTEYNYFYHKDIDNLQETFIDDGYKKSRITHYPYGSQYKVVELGNSMNENLLQFISYTFNDVKYFRLNPTEKRPGTENWKILKNYGKEIKEFNPDIMILCITYNHLKDDLAYFFKE